MQPNRAVLEHGGRGFLSKTSLVTEGSNFQRKSQQRGEQRDSGRAGEATPPQVMPRGKGRLRFAIEEAKCDGLGYGII